MTQGSSQLLIRLIVGYGRRAAHACAQLLCDEVSPPGGNSIVGRLRHHAIEHAAQDAADEGDQLQSGCRVGLVEGRVAQDLREHLQDRRLAASKHFVG